MLCVYKDSLTHPRPGPILSPHLPNPTHFRSHAKALLVSISAMTAPISASIAFLLATEFNTVAGGPPASNAHICRSLRFPGYPSLDTTAVPPGLTAKSSASIRRMWDDIATHPMKERRQLFWKPVGHAAAHALYRKWFMSTISRPMNNAIDALIGEHSPLHFLAGHASPNNASANSAQDADIFAEPRHHSYWPGSTLYNVLSGTAEFLVLFDDYVQEDGSDQTDPAASEAIADVLRAVWARHRKGWQRARAQVFGIESSNAPTPALEDRLWYKMVTAMEGEVPLLHHYVATC